MCDDEWNKFVLDEQQYNEPKVYKNPISDSTFIPKCSDIYISTKTQISHLDKPIDLKDVFWKIPVINYILPEDGVIKKQMKYNYNDKDEIISINNKLNTYPVVYQQIIKSIDDPIGIIKFKEVRKISVGLCKKDIMSYRRKPKGAFYNCFVLILRIKIEGVFKECHVKIFNTGKLELPGIRNDKLLNKILNMIVTILNACELDIKYVDNSTSTVLINSNFKTNYHIDRCRMVKLLHNKYKLNTSFDPSSYPGIMSKFYYDHNKIIQTGIDPGYTKSENKIHIQSGNLNEVSFMIFRTGSVLIVGKCVESTLHNIYSFLKHVLLTDYQEFYQKVKIIPKPILNKKIRKKNIVVN
jgi:TATA-box binding protein (TBP) (component of TFIID and TFIIIB)